MQITRHKYLTIEKYVEDESINYITFHKNTKHIQAYHTLDLNNFIDSYGNILCNQDKVLVFEREHYTYNISDTLQIKDAILNSSFSCKQIVNDKLFEFIQKKSNLHFIKDKDIILEEINMHIENNSSTQSLKMYNNILKRLKYLCLELFEKTQTQRDENHKNAMLKRDEKRKKEKLRKQMERNKPSFPTEFEMPDLSF